MTTFLAPSADGNLISSTFQAHMDSGTMTCHRGCEVPRAFVFCRSHDVSKAAPGIKTSLCKDWNGFGKRNKRSITASLSFEDASNSNAGRDYSQALSINANLPAGKEPLDTFRLSENGKEKVGVLLLNLGGPETLDDVQPFLYNLFADPDIIRLPRLLKFFQQPLAKFISFIRAPKSRAGYAAIGGGSPLRKITEDQANALKEALLEKNLSAKIYVGMRYWHPFTEEAIEKIKKDQITRLVVLPLYPQFSISTSGSSLRLLEEIFREDEYLASMQHTVIPSWYQREGYVKAMSTLIDQKLNTFKQPNEVVIFFSAHGVPRTYVEEAGDPYKDEMEKCVRLIMTEIRKRGIQNKHTLAYQSRVGPVEWLKPYTDDTIKELGQKGVKGLLAVPISFVSEHIETLEEIDVEYRELALESGITEWGRVPALGCEKTFISDLADAVIEELPNVGSRDVPTNRIVWTISRTLQDYFLPYGGRAWMEWLSGG